MTQKKQTTQPHADGKVDPIRAELATPPSTEVAGLKPTLPPEATAEPQRPEVTMTRTKKVTQADASQATVSMGPAIPPEAPISGAATTETPSDQIGSPAPSAAELVLPNEPATDPSTAETITPGTKRSGRRSAKQEPTEVRDERRLEKASKRLNDARAELSRAEDLHKKATDMVEAKYVAAGATAYKAFKQRWPNNELFTFDEILDVVGHAIAKRIGPSQLIAIIDREPAGE
jgi:predicted nucleic acid-binding protein